jgi:GWxTD domain-containing protein
MKFVIKYFILFIILSSVWPAAEASTKVPSENSLYLATDYASFKYSDNVDVCFTEIYYCLNRGQLSFQPDSSGYFAQVSMFIEIKTPDGAVIDSSTWNVANRIATLAEAEIQNYLINDVVDARLSPGNYDVTVKATDVYSDKTGESRIQITVPQFSRTDLNLSQIELVYKLGDADGGKFDKAGKKVIPNTRATYSHDDNLLYFYSEIYNLDTTLVNYTADIRVYDSNGNLYKALPPVTQNITSKSEVILHGFNIVAFKSGIYKLLVTIHAAGNSAFSEKNFEITPGRREWEIALEKEELSDFPEADEITTEEEAKRFRNQILYIANRDELRQYDSLPLQGKKNFARDFWLKRDPTPATPINEYKIEHYTRLRYANEAYSTFRAPGAEKNGWRSDRGRVYIVYGQPTDEENHPSALDELPWVRWNYDNVEGGVYFIFVDESGYGNYRLVHSSATGEPKDYNWESRLSPSSINLR